MDYFPMSLNAARTAVSAPLPMTVICDDERTVVPERLQSQATAFSQHPAEHRHLQELIEEQ